MLLSLITSPLIEFNNDSILHYDKTKIGCQCISCLLANLIFSTFKFLCFVKAAEAAKLFESQSLTKCLDTLLNVFLAIAVDNLANAQELTKVTPAQGSLTLTCPKISNAYE